MNFKSFRNFCLSCTLILRDFFFRTWFEARNVVLSILHQFFHHLNSYTLVIFFSKYMPKSEPISFRELANKNYEFGDGYQSAIPLLVMAHELDEAIRIKGIEGVIGKPLRVFDAGWVANIGHTSLLAQFPKMEKCGLASPSLKILPFTFSPNQTYLDLLSDYFTFIRLSNRTYSSYKPFLDRVSEKMGSIRVNGAVLEEYAAFNTIEASYRARFGLNSSIFGKTSVNVPEKQLFELDARNLLSSKFVGIHVRDSVTPTTRSAGNCDISTYVEAIELLVDSGIKVVIQGNSKMKKLPEELQSHPMIWDYAHFPEKHPSLDMYFMANAYFLVGTGSGPITIGNDFGVKTLYTNLPCIGYHYDLRGYSLPHLIIDKRKNELQSYSIMEKDSLAWSIREETHTSKRQRNSSAEIKEAVMDMLEECKEDSLNHWYENRFKQFFCGERPAMTVAPSFYSKYAEVFSN